MKLRIRNDRMEEVEGLFNEYPYVFHHVDLSKTAIPWHWHEELEFCYIQTGSVKVATAGQTQTFQAGEGFFINSNVLTAMTDAYDCVIDSHLFHPVFLGGHFKSIYETKYLNPVIQNRNLDMLPIRGETGTQKQLLQKIRHLSRLQSQQDVELQTRNLLSEIWLLLLEALKHTQLKASPVQNQDRILTLLAYRGGLPVSWGNVLESAGYVFVTVLGVMILKERVGRDKLIALGVILAGILMFTL